MDAPKRYSMSHNRNGLGFYNGVEEDAEGYLMTVSEHDRIVAEKDARIAELEEALTRITWALDEQRGAMEAAALSYARAALKGDDNG